MRLYAPAILAFWNQRTQQRQLYKNKVLGAEDFNERRLQRKGLVTLIRYVWYRRDKQSAIANAELFQVRKLQDRALRGMIWHMVTRREKVRKQSLAHQTVSSVCEQLSLKSCFRALRENWTSS